MLLLQALPGSLLLLANQGLWALLSSVVALFLARIPTRAVVTADALVLRWFFARRRFGFETIESAKVRPDPRPLVLGRRAPVFELRLRDQPRRLFFGAEQELRALERRLRAA